MSKGRKKVVYNDAFWAGIFLLPSLIGLVIFTIYPLFKSFYLSFTDWDFVHKANFIGTANYIKMFSDTKFIRVLQNTLAYTAVTVPVLMIVPLILAVALNQKIKGIRFFRAAYFVPVIASTVSVSLIWPVSYTHLFTANDAVFLLLRAIPILRYAGNSNSYGMIR